MADLFKSLEWADGQINPSGIKTIVYYAPKSWIKTFPRIVSPVLTSEENIVVAGDFEMVTGKTFLKLYSTQGKGKVDWEPMGEKDHKMFLNKGSFSFPDIGVDARSTAKQTINSNIVVIVALPHESEKRFIMIGDADYDVTVTIKGTTGDKPGSEKGITFDIEAPCTTPMPGYAGALPLADGILDCESGVFTPTPTATLAISADSLSIPAIGSEPNISINTTAAWTAASSQAWFTLSALSGIGSEIIVGTAAANTGAERTCTVTVTVAGITPEVLTFTQAAA